MSLLTKRRIKNDVSEFFHVIKSEFKKIDAINTSKSMLIATQVKLFYLKIKETEDNQDIVYNQMVEWLNKRTNVSKEACSIIISYYVQSCEVFDVISK